MRFTRLFSATALVAAVTLLASCGESSSPTAPGTATDPSLDLGPRTYQISGNANWTKLPADPIPTDSRTVLISGIIAVATYPTFGTPVYTGTNAGSNWLDMNLAPNFSMTPLGWKVTFKLKQSAQALPIGNYTATIPVMVPAAFNNPQNIVVTFSNCGNCLFLGDSRLATVSAGQDFNISNFFSPGGGWFYDEYRLFLLAGQTAFVQVHSSAFGGGATIGDPRVSVFLANSPIFTFLGQNDDCFGLSSEVPVTNFTGATVEYRVRATTFSSGVTGTETVFISPTSYCGGGGDDLLDASIRATIAAKKLNGSN